MNGGSTFRGQVAVVTGTAQGLGLALAEALAAADAHVNLTDVQGELVSAESVHLTIKRLPALGPRSRFPSHSIAK